jgi:pyrroloquinoline quinone biosynthesis protein E|tara:strand:+ start:668 stop:1846 length:1179 start_codon:yes stop_codon:yes gene_type:complete
MPDKLIIPERTYTEAPMAILAELTHRCPLSCGYCSNPLELVKKDSELTTDEWLNVIDQAAKMGIYQIHFSGGEPTLREDLEIMVEHADKKKLYCNLITSGVLLTRKRLEKLQKLGVKHVQLSLQDSDSKNAERIGNYKGSLEKKIEVAEWLRELKIPLTINAVMHRQNLHNLEDIIQLSLDLDAHRIEIANVQFYGWALKNRAAFMPTKKQALASKALVDKLIKKLKGIIIFDYVLPDYYAKKPKSCMFGWGRQSVNVTPEGFVLPCGAAETIKSLKFENIKDEKLAWIWEHSSAFNMFRGTDWMPEPCKSCDHREIDWGGCRCQALALTGDVNAVDPTCELSPFHEKIFGSAFEESSKKPPEFVYRKPTNKEIEPDKRNISYSKKTAQESK